MDDRGKERLLTWSSGGWLITAAVLLMLAIIIWQAILVFGGKMRTRVIGDGRDPDTYGFDLGGLLVDRDLLVGSGRDYTCMRVMMEPAVIDAAGVAREGARSKFLVSDDLVIGVSVAGESRAYPLLVMNWHEIVNDVLGGVPIVVTWHPWSGGIAAFDRRVGGEALELGFSGLVHNSGQVLFDRRDDSRGESLWLQLDGRAVSGPAGAAGARLRPLLTQLLPWRAWVIEHPDTTVLDPDTPYRKQYKSPDPYGPYRTDDRRLDYLPHIEPLPPTDGLPWKEHVLIVTLGDLVDAPRRAYPLSWLADRADTGGVFRDTIGETPVLIRVQQEPLSAWLESPAGGAASAYAYWFAWFAMHSGAPGLPE